MIRDRRRLHDRLADVLDRCGQRRTGDIDGGAMIVAHLATLENRQAQLAALEAERRHEAQAAKIVTGRHGVSLAAVSMMNGSHS